MAQTTFSGPVLEGKEGVNIETKTSNYTVVTGDSGKTFVSSTDGVVFTLPAIAIGYSFKFVNNAPDGTNALTLSPNSSDGSTYAGSSTDDKDLINTNPVLALAPSLIDPAFTGPENVVVAIIISS